LEEKLSKVFIDNFPNYVVETLTYMKETQKIEFDKNIQVELKDFCKKHVNMIQHDMDIEGPDMGKMGAEDLVRYLANIFAAQIVFIARYEGRRNVEKSDKDLAFYKFPRLASWGKQHMPRSLKENLT